MSIVYLLFLPVRIFYLDNNSKEEHVINYLQNRTKGKSKSVIFCHLTESKDLARKCFVCHMRVHYYILNVLRFMVNANDNHLRIKSHSEQPLSLSNEPRTKSNKLRLIEDVEFTLITFHYS